MGGWVAGWLAVGRGTLTQLTVSDASMAMVSLTCGRNERSLLVSVTRLCALRTPYDPSARAGVVQGWPHHTYTYTLTNRYVRRIRRCQAGQNSCQRAVIERPAVTM
ncbi:unnamed protein product [Strongylus vulgaris]|uniref:Secreted protein n=1 Tax=Strongylus vulgaris TaxID=40348 RepID=A0A3P7KIC0_STRVU|nr:unnamed protein product [Strongylus vulgaris]